ncbi:hypothetical protein D3C81_1639910 [compost metagenome]
MLASMIWSSPPTRPRECHVPPEHRRTLDVDRLRCLCHCHAGAGSVRLRRTQGPSRFGLRGAVLGHCLEQPGRRLRRAVMGVFERHPWRGDRPGQDARVPHRLLDRTVAVDRQHVRLRDDLQLLQSTT